MTDGPQAALAAIESLERDGSPAGYHHLPAARAGLLQRLGHPANALEAYLAALALTSNTEHLTSNTEQEFLTRRVMSARQQAGTR